MKTNITIDNYEAYLLDYMEGNLSPEGAAQLKQFVATQGLDWDELTEALPQLEAPTLTFEDKDKLKKEGAVVPLYVKIASAAAAAGLLITVTLWPERQMPELEPIAELKPILPGRIITANEIPALPQRTIQFIPTRHIAKETPSIQERGETQLVAELAPIKAQVLPAMPSSDASDFELLAYRMSNDLDIAQIEEKSYADEAEEERNLSLIGKGLYRLTNGQHDNFASLIGSGVRRAKQDLTDVATDMALAAYQRADEQIEEARDRWEEKRGN